MRRPARFMRRSRIIWDSFSTGRCCSPTVIASESEAIQKAASKIWIASSQALLATTNPAGFASKGKTMNQTLDVKVLVFDVFGTVVDWRSSLIADFTKWSQTRGIKADWTALVDGWRAVYAASMDVVRKNPQNGYVILDTLHRQSLETLVAQLGISGLTDADLHYLTMGWHRLHPWPDSVSGLTRLKTKYIISPLSNGNVALLTNMAKFAGLPWDLVMSAELFEHYKPA